MSDWEVKDKVWQTPFTFSSAGNRLVALPDHTHSSLIRVSEGFLQQVKRAMASRPKYCFFPKGILHGRYGLERESFPPVPIPAYRIMCLSDFRPTDISRINTGPLTPPRATTYGKQVIRFRVNLDEISWACGQPS